MKILIADDHALFREGMRHVLAQLNDDVTVIEAADHSEVFDQIETQGDIALALLDLHMPHLDGFSALEQLSLRYPALPIVVLSASESRTDMQRVLDRGAMGFVQKSSTAKVMLSALNLVLAGGVYVPPAMVQLREFKSSGRSDGKVKDSADNSIEDVARDNWGLTPRQLDVLARMIEGQPNKIIADDLGLSIATVKAHVTATLKALKVTNRTQAAHAVERSGLNLSINRT